MLDDLKLIHERDAQDAFGVAEKQWQQLNYGFQVTVPSKNFTTVVFAGMGGSALAGLLSRTWPGYDVPFEVCRNYSIPSYTDGGTLFIAASYSGNTEETLEAVAQAEGKGATIVVIASGGQLAKIAKDKGYPLALLPEGMQPRMSVLYALRATAAILEEAGLANGAVNMLVRAAQFLREHTANWRPDVPTGSNLAKQIALELMGKSPVVYAGPLLSPAAYKWKISFNENAKNVAWCGQYPEFNHNEFIGWSSHPVQKPYAVVDLRSTFEHSRVQKRFEVSERLLSGKRPAPIVVSAEGTTVLEHLLWCVALGDFVSLYLAILNGLNPTPVELIEKFKAALNE